MARRLFATALLLLTTACSAVVPGRPVAGPVPPAEPVPTVDCRYPLTVEGLPYRGNPPEEGPVPARGTLKIRFDTNRGRVDVELDAASAPCSVHGFRHLVKQGAYRSSSCHRLTVTGIWVLQCGDTDADDGFDHPGFTYDDPTAKTGDYARGVVAMANQGVPGTNGSQFFIVHRDSPEIGPDFPVVGRVTTGMDVIDRVAAGGVVPGTGYAEGDGEPVTSLVLLVVAPA